MEIITNNHYRPFLFGYEIPETVLNDGFDWLDNDEKNDGFIYYRGRYCHLSEFMRVPESAPFSGNWSGYFNDGAFSGVLIEISDDCEQYKIATFIS